MPDREPHGFDVALLVAMIALTIALAILLGRSFT